MLLTRGTRQPHKEPGILKVPHFQPDEIVCEAEPFGESVDVNNVGFGCGDGGCRFEPIAASEERL
jgi:hypothetical protein